jgi:hypothetical protein
VFRETACTSFAGVPYSYQVLHRLGVDALNVTSLRTMTQAGGRLHNDFARAAANGAGARPSGNWSSGAFRRRAAIWI